jgi:methylenetetrahydrofolate reductase (NADPH)
MAGLNEAKIPDALQARLDEVAGDVDAVRALAVETCSGLAQRLLDAGAPGIHLCTLNYSGPARQIWANLGLT